MINPLTRMLCTVTIVMTMLTACGEPPSEPEAEVRAWVAAGVEAAENKERRGLIGLVSESYVDARGNDRNDIEDMLRIYFLRQHKIGLLTKIEEITIYGDTAARLIMTVGMAGTNDGVLGFSADAYRFDMELEKDGGEWQLIAARWGELGNELK